ncbi:MAG: M13 family metallopeptidase [Xanthomonadales bacterium]|nr:M13 family metallopeptidase [Xanthomonadales bacterium]
MKKLSFALAAALLMTACQQQSSEPNSMSAEKPAASTMEAPALVSGIDTQGFDSTVRPQDDFYQYVNGQWLAKTEIPADKSNYGSFTKLADDADQNIRSLVEEVSQESSVAAGSAEQKIRDFYNAYMAGTEAGAAALQTELDQIDSIQSLDDFYRVAGSLARLSVNAPFGGGIFSDSKDPNVNVVYLGQAGLTLPDRDYYLEDEERYSKGRDLFLTYAEGIFQCLGDDNGAARAQSLLDFERQLAEVQWTREENRDPDKRYNPKSPAELAAMAPQTNFTAYFEGAGVPSRDVYVVSQPSYMEAADKIVASTPLNVLKDYLRFQTVESFATVLGKEYFTLWFDFHRKGLQGQEEPREQWKRALDTMDGYMGELLGQVYVKRHFNAEAKTRMQGMINNLVKAYDQSIQNLDWMSAETKTQAQDKLSKFNPKIGYPDDWRDYSDLTVVEGDLVGNIRSARLWQADQEVAKLDKPVDKNEWFMSPQTVNAYYNPLWNEIVFPAAILQPPFFNMTADDAVNYGGIGAVIGHEIGHGFDDSGRKFAGDGSLTDWWTEADASEFEIRKNKLAAQYDNFIAIEDLPINGQFTSGENIGDLGGLSIAYKAYKLSLDGKEAPVIDGLTGDQRFFMGWAQVWRRLYRDEELKRRLTVDPHSPSKARTNVVVSNIPAFIAAFDVKEGDGMYLPPEDQVKIW